MNRRGVTLIELLITIVIGGIAMLALVVPFSAERIFWLKGDAQAEAQRDAQLVLRAIARTARESGCYELTGIAQITLYAGVRVGGNCTGAVNGCFRRFGSQFESYAGTNCTGTPMVLINGGRSQVTVLTLSRPVAGSDRLAQVQQLTVTNTRGTQQSSEQMATNLYLRNAS